MREFNINIGGGFLLLTILFIILKVTNNINWSWWLVFAPMWIPWSIFIAIVTLIIVGFLVTVFALMILNIFKK